MRARRRARRRGLCGARRRTAIADRHRGSAGASGRAGAGRSPSGSGPRCSGALFDEIATLPAGVGVLAVIDTPAPAPPARVDFCLLVDDVQDPGNVGSMLRTAAAAGAASVLLSKHSAFAWSPKVLRAGQGAHFCVDIHEDVDLPALGERASRGGRRSDRRRRSGRDDPLRNAASRAPRRGNRQRRRGLVAVASRRGDAARDDSDAARRRIAERRGGNRGAAVRVCETAQRGAFAAIRSADHRSNLVGS